METDGREYFLRNEAKHLSEEEGGGGGGRITKSSESRSGKLAPHRAENYKWPLARSSSLPLSNKPFKLTWGRR